MLSVADLAAAHPHTRKNVKLSPAEHAIYAEGYYTGITYALKVAQLAADRYKLATRTRRAARRQKATA